jgi:hypothetical protein
MQRIVDAIDATDGHVLTPQVQQDLAWLRRRALKLKAAIDQQAAPTG